jgi:hypothetical protein
MMGLYLRDYVTGTALRGARRSCKGLVDALLPAFFKYRLANFSGFAR